MVRPTVVGRPAVELGTIPEVSSSVKFDRAAQDLIRQARGETTMATADLIHAGISDSEHKVQLRRAVVAATIGTAIEWYDFFLYSTVTGLVFAKLYFPNSDPWVGTL